MRRPLFLALVLALAGGALLLAGGGVYQGTSTVGRLDVPAGESAAIGGSSGMDYGKDAMIAPQPYPGIAGDGTAMIRTGAQTLQVEDLDAAIAEAERLAKGIGAVLVGSSRGGGYGIYDATGALLPGSEGPAVLSYRIEATEFAAIRTVFLPLGELLADNSSASDVSASLRDLGARLTSLRAAEKAYLALYERAETVDEVLNVQSRLDGLRAEIESMAAQEAALADQVAMSSFTLTLSPKAAPVAEATAAFDPGAVFDGALADLLRFGQSLFGALIYLAVFALPIGALLLVRRKPR